jgi:hypothetical protein
MTTAEDADTVFDAVEATFFAGLRWAAVGITLVVLYALELPVLLTNRAYYVSVAAQVAAFTVFTAVALVEVVAILRGRRVRGSRWLWVTLVLLASAVATMAVVPERLLGIPHWSFGTVGWLLVLLTLGEPIGVLAALLGTHYLVTAVQVAVAGQAATTLVGAFNQAVISSTFQLMVAMLAALLRRIAESASIAGRAEERLRTADAISERLDADRARRTAELATTSGPLLAGLASGRLDPADPQVRRRCAVEAARMRRLFVAESADLDPLVNQLRACIELAERGSGLRVHFAERGEPRSVPVQARLALTEAAATVLATATDPVRITLVRTSSEIVVSVITTASPAVEAALAAVRVDDVALTTVTTAERVQAKATWRCAT